MATDLHVRSTTVKRQSVWAWLGLTLITFGIYNWFWYYRINRELRDIGRAYGAPELAASSPGMSAFAQFVPIANLFSLHGTGKRIRRAELAIDGRAAYGMLPHWLLAIFTGLWPMYAQSTLNGLWDRAIQLEAAQPPVAIPMAATAAPHSVV